MNYSRRRFVQTLFIASQASLLGRLAFADSVDDDGKDALHFTVIGDWGRRGQPDQQRVATQMGAMAQTLGAAFVISAGDNFYEDGVLSVDDSHWKQSYGDVYHAPSLQVPWYAILGNHDYHGNCQAQLDYAKAQSRWVMPARYYTQSRTLGSSSAVDFFFIDTSPMLKSYRSGEKAEHPQMRENVLSQDVPTQLAWLEKNLAGSKAPWKIVIGHHPIYSGGVHGDQQELIEGVLPLLQRYKVQAYFCGHDHDLQHLKAGGVNLFVSGGGSEHRPNHEVPQSQFGKSSSGFMAVSLSGGGLTVRVVDDLGNLIYRTKILS